jgi:hypothetical protein
VNQNSVVKRTETRLEGNFIHARLEDVRSEHKVALLLEAGGELLFPESQYVAYTSLVRASPIERCFNPLKAYH